MVLILGKKTLIFLFIAIPAIIGMGSKTIIIAIFFWAAILILLLYEHYKFKKWLSVRIKARCSISKQLNSD